MKEDYTDIARRHIRSFVIRSGRMTSSQRQAYERGWARWGLESNQAGFNWPDVFQNENPVTIEIGFGMGDSLAVQAQTQPDTNFVGIEVHTPGIGRLLSLLEKHALGNVRIIEGDAVSIMQTLVPRRSINTFNVFFPDPWHKKKHHKRRLLQAEFIRMLAEKIKPGGTLHIATDWQNYAEEIIATLEQEPAFSRLSVETDAPPETRRDRPDTKFERRGQRRGHSVWDIIYIAN